MINSYCVFLFDVFCLDILKDLLKKCILSFYML